TEPWTLRVEGEVARPGTLDVAQLIAAGGLEERIYRMRCVEAWSMVIPWVGLELGRVLKGFEPTSRATLRGLRDPPRPGADARPEIRLPGWRHRLPLCGGAAHRRGHAPPDPAGGGHLRPDPAAPERRAPAPGGALEVR